MPETQPLELVQKFQEQLLQKFDGLQKQVDTLDSIRQRPDCGGYGGGNGKDLASEVFENAQFKAFAETGRGRVAIPIPDFQQKTAVLSSTLGYSTPGIVASERIPGITPAALRTFRVRDLLRKIPTTAGMIDFVRVNSYTPASPTAENVEKNEATMTFEDVSEKMRTLAHWIPVSRQVLQDVTGLQEAINTHLLAGLWDTEDEEILNGDGSDEHFHGLVHLATSFDSTLLSAVAGHEYADILGWAIAQLATAKRRASAMVLNPLDYWSIKLTKDADGQYLHPAGDSFTSLWGLPVAVTDAMTQGTFLVGAFNTGAVLYTRMDAVILASDSHLGYFTLNKLALLCEMRELLATATPDAFVTGTFSTSP